MPIISIDTTQTGQVSVLPSYASINTSDTEATVLTTGYLNREVANGATFQLPCIAKVSTQATPTSAQKVGWYNVAHVGTNWSLTPLTSPGDIVLPTITNHMIASLDTLGTLGNLTGTIIQSGSIQAGLSAGTAGTFISYPGTGNKGALILAAVASTGNFNTTISNAAMGQATVISIPDPGASTAKFIISAAASSPQQITSGGLQVTNGSVTVGQVAGSASTDFFVMYPQTTAKGLMNISCTNNAANYNIVITNASFGQASTLTIPDPSVASASFVMSSFNGTQVITGGNLQVGAGSITSGISSGGFEGQLNLYSNTAGKGAIVVKCADNSVNAIINIVNASFGQTSTLTMPDPGGASADFVFAPSALVNNNLVKASGTAGLIVDAGIPAANVMVLNASNVLTGSGQITLVKASAAESGNAVTASGNAGVITTSSLTTAGGANYAITWTNTLITATSVINLTIMGGSNSSTQNITLTATAGSGTSTLTIYNNTAATALNGTILIGYTVL